MGVGALTSNATLDTAAQLRSTEIVTTFSHTRPDGTDCYTAIDPNFTCYIRGENICMTSHLGDGSGGYEKWTGADYQIEAAAAWTFKLFKESSGHYANMIHEDYTMCGVGISYTMETVGIPYFYTAHMFAG